MSEHRKPQLALLQLVYSLDGELERRDLDPARRRTMDGLFQDGFVSRAADGRYCMTSKGCAVIGEPVQMLAPDSLPVIEGS